MFFQIRIAINRKCMSILIFKFLMCNVGRPFNKNMLIFYSSQTFQALKMLPDPSKEDVEIEVWKSLIHVQCSWREKTSRSCDLTPSESFLWDWEFRWFPGITFTRRLRCLPGRFQIFCLLIIQKSKFLRAFQNFTQWFQKPLQGKYV